MKISKNCFVSAFKRRAYKNRCSSSLLSALIIPPVGGNCLIIWALMKLIQCIIPHSVWIFSVRCWMITICVVILMFDVLITSNIVIGTHLSFSMYFLPRISLDVYWFYTFVKSFIDKCNKFMPLYFFWDVHVSSFKYSESDAFPLVVGNFPGTQYTLVQFWEFLYQEHPSVPYQII